MSTFHTLTMKGGPHGSNTEIYLDGYRLKGVIGLRLETHVGDVVRVSLDLIVQVGVLVDGAVIELPPLEDLPPHLHKIHADIAALIEAQP